jgi:hypothetical protein
LGIGQSGKIAGVGCQQAVAALIPDASADMRATRIDSVAKEENPHGSYGCAPAIKFKWQVQLLS